MPVRFETQRMRRQNVIVNRNVGRHHNHIDICLLLRDGRDFRRDCIICRSLNLLSLCLTMPR